MLTRDKIIDYIYNSEPVMGFYQSAMAVGFWPEFPCYQIEEITWYLDKARVSDIKKIDCLLLRHKENLVKYINNIYESRKSPWRVNPAYLCKLVIVFNFIELFKVEDLTSNGWGEDTASIVIRAANLFRSEFSDFEV